MAYSGSGALSVSRPEVSPSDPALPLASPRVDVTLEGGLWYSVAVDTGLVGPEFMVFGPTLVSSSGGANISEGIGFPSS